MEGAVAPLREAGHLALPLAEQPFQRDIARSEYAKIAVEWENEIRACKRLRYSHGDRLLPDAGEPLADLSLAQQQQHAFLDHARKQYGLVQSRQRIVAIVRSVEAHRRIGCAVFAGDGA